MKFISGLAALLCLSTPALAWDNDPASFRRDPQGWVRKNLMPTCQTPDSAEKASLCDCMVPLLASHTTEADVARVNDPDFKPAGFGKIAVGAGLLCMPRK
jgi:hypothetical protein